MNKCVSRIGELGRGCVGTVWVEDLLTKRDIIFQIYIKKIPETEWEFYSLQLSTASFCTAECLYLLSHRG